MSSHPFFYEHNVPYYVSPHTYLGKRIDNMIHKHNVVIELESKIKDLYEVINNQTEEQLMLLSLVNELQESYNKLERQLHNSNPPCQT